MRLRRPASLHLQACCLLAAFCFFATGCSRLKHKQQNDTVYVLSKQTFLRDRVAAVSNRVAVVENGQPLEVLDHARRFLKVKTARGEIGWIEEHAVVAPQVVAGFADLKKNHEHDPVIATGVLRDDGYMHLKPGRDTERFYLLPENDKLQLLVRASVPRELAPQAASAKHAGATASHGAAGKAAAPGAPASALPPSAALPATLPNGDPIPMEDWWLVRDSQGKVGWLMSRRMDVDVPDEIAGYAEGQRIVGAYLLDKREDPDSNFPDKQAPEYVTVLNPYKDGLPYDFSQVRVFTWNLRKHRYETAYRQRNLQGYLPVVVSRQTFDKAGPVPTFQFKNGIGDGVAIDPATGATKPLQTETLTYRLDGSLVKKVEPAAPAAPAKAPISAAAPASGRTRIARHRRHPLHARHHHRP